MPGRFCILGVQEALAAATGDARQRGVVGAKVSSPCPRKYKGGLGWFPPWVCKKLGLVAVARMAQPPGGPCRWSAAQPRSGTRHWKPRPIEGQGKAGLADGGSGVGEGEEGTRGAGVESDQGTGSTCGSQPARPKLASTQKSSLLSVCSG